MTKRLFLLASFFAIFYIANGQSEYQTNYYDLVKQVRQITKEVSQLLKTSKNNQKKLLDFRQDIFEVIKLADRLDEEAGAEAFRLDKEALAEGVDNSAKEKVLDDIAFGCNICETLLNAVDLKIKYETKKYDTYIERLKSIELGVTLQVKTEEIIK